LAADVARLLGSPLLAGRQGRCRTSKVATVWHDTAGGLLRTRGLALAEQSGVWRLERLVPNGAGDWMPAAPAPVLAEAGAPGPLVAPHFDPVADPLVPVAAFTGTRRSYGLQFGDQAACLDVLEGSLRGVAQEKAACRVRISGPRGLNGTQGLPKGLAGFAAELAAGTGLTVPRAGLAADAVAVAHGTATEPRHLGAPEVPPGVSVGESLRLLTAHLADVILYWAPIAPVGDAPEPVHQMRVAVRRLRAALSAYRAISAGPELADLGDALKGLAKRLGEARDWDVFLHATGRAVGKAFADDGRIAALLDAAARKRAASYAALQAYVESEEWRLLSVRLAMVPAMQPWADPSDAEQMAILAEPAETYAARTLERLNKKVQRAGADLGALAPAELHAVRKRAKKLRYAAEFFAPLFPHKKVNRFLEKLEELQEALGTVNDGHVAADLTAQLGQGTNRAFAAGVIQGYVAACSGGAASKAARRWEKYRSQETFWG
jgi:triphosphatase